METKTRAQLAAVCKERGIKGYSGKSKSELLALLGAAPPAPPTDRVIRLNYIGSKFQLLDWISATMLAKTGWADFKGKSVADPFAGTGIVSYFFRKQGTTVLSNDAELYSSIIAHALTRSTYNDTVKGHIAALQADTTTRAGYITRHYSPSEGNERKFFTTENAGRIDFLRARIEELRPTLSADDHAFLLASLLVSADAVSNVPAVYGCFLKNFKAKATKELVLQPVHTLARICAEGSTTTNADVLQLQLEADAVYLDPPYNERQYSKNYFPLNAIAKTPAAVEADPPLKGKTGIPADCFLSPFCSKSAAEGAFETLFRTTKAAWIFLSYNSESIVSKDRMLELMKKYGEASVVECDYKRFKSFEYNEDKPIKEYLFCLARSPPPPSSP
jgi:adenine-specific DNA-methyltransferase